MHILIDGISGTGKTFLVKCLAGHVSMPLLTIDSIPSDQRLSNQLFAALLSHVKSSAPTIVLFDSLDTILSSKDSDHSAECSSTVNQLAQFMDNVGALTQSIVIATVKDVSEIDSSLTR